MRVRLPPGAVQFHTEAVMQAMIGTAMEDRKELAERVWRVIDNINTRSKYAIRYRQAIKALVDKHGKQGTTWPHETTVSGLDDAPVEIAEGYLQDLLIYSGLSATDFDQLPKTWSLPGIKRWLGRIVRE